MPSQLLLSGPLLCQIGSGTTSLRLPVADAAVSELALAILPLPSPAHFRHEHDAVIAAQGAEGSRTSWSLTYSVAERKLRWHIRGFEEAAAHGTSPSARYQVCLRATPATTTSSDLPSASPSPPPCITISTSAPVLPFSLTIVHLEHDRAAQTFTMRVDQGSTETAMYKPPVSPSSYALFTKILHLADSAPQSSPFLGLISDVTFTGHNNAASSAVTRSTLTPQSLLSYFPSLPLTPTPALIPPSLRAEPMHSLSQLLAWEPSGEHVEKTTIPFPVRRSNQEGKRRKVIHCHDMAGGFNEDTDAQNGARQSHCYNFQWWKFIDIFVYFSHARIAVPPAMWITAAHRNGVAILGNFCTEWAEGERENIRLLDGLVFDATPNAEPHWKRYAQKMVELAVEYNFDGWFLNIEAALPQMGNSTEQEEEEQKVEILSSPPLSPSSPSSSSPALPSSPTAPPPPLSHPYVVKLVEFLRYLTSLMHKSRPGSLVLWYDSVRASDGRLKWQSRLNDENRCFFDACDGIFTDYHWSESWPKSSSAVAGVRKYDIFTGVDLYGRGSYGGGGYDIVNALKVIQDAQTSVALFAPAWTYEGENRVGKEREAFLAAERKLWIGVEEWKAIPFPDAEARSEDKPSTFSSWTITEDGGQGWNVVLRDLRAKSYCCITSHEWCMREQTIDLLAGEAVTREYLDKHQPSIRVQAECAGTPPNNADYYRLSVSLLDLGMQELAKFEVDTRLTTSEWTTFSHTFSHYGPGVRYLKWIDGGKDGEKWAGHFGTRIGKCEVEINVSANAERRPCIAQYVDVQRVPFDAFIHSFNTGHGKLLYNDGHHVSKQAWFNLAHQDCQTMMVDGLLCDGMLQPIEHTGSLHLQAHSRITHEVAYDGGSSFEIEVRANGNVSLSSSVSSPPSSPPVSPSKSKPNMFLFDCFEFGLPSTPSDGKQGWTIDYVYSAPANYQLALRLVLEDDSDILLVDDCSVQEDREWVTARHRLTPAQLGRHVITKLQWHVTYLGFAGLAGDDAQYLRIGQVCVRRSTGGATSSLSALAVFSSAPVVRRFNTLASFTSETPAPSFLLSWSHVPCPLDSVWDIYVDERWCGRVRQPVFYLDGSSLQQLLTPTTPADLPTAIVTTSPTLPLRVQFLACLRSCDGSELPPASCVLELQESS